MNTAQRSLKSHMQKTVICAEKTAQEDQKRTNLKTLIEKTDISVRYINYQVSAQTPALQQTLQRSSRGYDLIVITEQQLNAFKLVYKEYGLKKPGWLRQKFYINRPRRSKLNRIIENAGCITCKGEIGNDWSGQLHLVWHLINGSSLCD